MAAWRKEKVDASRHRQEKIEATRLGRSLAHTEAAWNFAERHPLALSTSRRNPFTDVRPTETCVAPVDASRDFYYFLQTSSVEGGVGVCCQTFIFLFSFPCSADHERDWPPRKVVFRFFGLATNTLNVRNNNNNNNC